MSISYKPDITLYLAIHIFNMGLKYYMKNNKIFIIKVERGDEYIVEGSFPDQSMA
jgi:hypothetical protein